MITLYTKTVCPKCVFIKNRLESSGVEYELINIDQNEEAKEMLIGKGFKQAPIMSHEGTFILDPSEMNAIIEDLTS